MCKPRGSCKTHLASLPSDPSPSLPPVYMVSLGLGLLVLQHIPNNGGQNLLCRYHMPYNACSVCQPAAT